MWELFVFIFWYFAVPVGLAYLGGRLLSPDAPKAEGEIEGAASRMWNPHSTQQEGLARHRSYGKNLHHGNIVAKWTDVDGNEREILYMIIDHGDGPTKGVVAPFTDNVFINDQPASNFGTVTIQERIGTMNQTCMTGFEKPKLEYKQDTELKYGEAVTVVTTPNDFFDDLEYTIMFPNGLIKYHKDGDSCNYYVHLRVRISEHGLEDWTVLFDSNITARQRKPLFKKYVVSAQGFNCVRGKQYDLEFQRTAPGADDSRRTSTSVLRSVREVIDTAFTRPGKALVGIKAVATAQLSGSLDVKVIREDRIINTYDGTSWTLEYSNNRAWVAWDVATLPAIDGDGDGNPWEIARYDGLAPKYLDLEFFYAWAQFCAEEIDDGYGGVEARCACNLKLTEFADMFTTIHNIAAVGRAYLYWSGNLLTGWIDDVVTTPIDLVTMDTMMSKTWKNTWAITPELAGKVEVFYEDEKQGYERTPAEWSNDETDGYKNTVTAEGIGLKTRGSAVHYAHYLLERNRLIRNVNKFKVHKDGFRYKLGDTIRLQCRIANWGKAYRVSESDFDDTELIGNGDFSAWTDDDPDDWGITGESGADPEVSEVGTGEGHGGTGNGCANMYTSDGTWLFLAHTFTTEVGRRYRVSIKVDKITNGSILCRESNNALWWKLLDSEGTHTWTFVATSTVSVFWLRNYLVALTDVTIDDVSITVCPSITVDRDVESEVSVGDVIHIRSYNTVLSQVVTDTYEVDSVSGRVIIPTINWDVTPLKGNLVAVGPAGAIKLRRIVKLTPTVDNYFDVEVETYDVDLFDADNLDPANPNVNYIWPTPVPPLGAPITRAEMEEYVSQHIPTPPDIDIPWMSNITWNNNTPGAGSISWSKTDADDDITFRLKGTTHIITADDTDKEFIYWKPSSPTVFTATNVFPTAELLAGSWLMCRNLDGVAYPANAVQLLHAGIIMAGTVIAEHFYDVEGLIVGVKTDTLSWAINGTREWYHSFATRLDKQILYDVKPFYAEADQIWQCRLRTKWTQTYHQGNYGRVRPELWVGEVHKWSGAYQGNYSAWKIFEWGPITLSEHGISPGDTVTVKLRMKIDTSAVGQYIYLRCQGWTGDKVTTQSPYGELLKE